MATISTMLRRAAQSLTVPAWVPVALALVPANPLHAQAPAVELEAVAPIENRLLVALDSTTLRHPAALASGETACVSHRLPEIEVIVTRIHALLESLADATRNQSPPKL
jgi:hypothetical protein